MRHRSAGFRLMEPKKWCAPYPRFGLQRAFPEGDRYWGLARKSLNIFLRDCLYTVYLREAHGLQLAERYFEVPLNSLTGCAPHKTAPHRLPRWRTVRSLTADFSDMYQTVATEIARSRGIARVHLDVFWWGSREESSLDSNESEQ